MPPRTVAVWCPDWPVTAVRAAIATDKAKAQDQGPLAIVTANQVVACDHRARAAGVRRGLRRREAQSRCPELTVLARDETAEARLFEPVVLALESIAPGVEVTRPGLAAIGLRGPARYFGGEDGVLHALSRAVANSTDPDQDQSASGFDTDVLIGVADGAFAAEQAARRGLVIAPGESAPFLADLPVSTLDPSGSAPLIDLLQRLGLRTLGAFAALPARDVLARFGPDGAWAHRQAGGRDDRPVAGRRPAVEFAVELSLEPALDRVDAVAFSARGLAEQFVTDLADHGLACACLELQALSENGEETVRRWRHAGVLSPVDVLDRVRWQLEGWLTGPGRPTGGVARLRLVPIETVPTGTHQQALWGSSGTEDERAHRALARVQTLLGHGSVLTLSVQGGRSPAQRTELTAWGDDPEPMRSPQQPWPGSLPAPAPSVLIDPPRPIRVLDQSGHSVEVTDRGAVPMPPARVAIGPGPEAAIQSWAGPWPVDERWWDDARALRAARFQLVDVHGHAYLASCRLGSGEPAQWVLEAVYD
jgi:protein ImuB